MFELIIPSEIQITFVEKNLHFAITQHSTGEVSFEGSDS